MKKETKRELVEYLEKALALAEDIDETENDNILTVHLMALVKETLHLILFKFWVR